MAHISEKQTFETEDPRVVSDAQIAGHNKLTRGAIKTLIGAWLVNLIIGAQLAMGNISVYFVSYYKKTLDQDVSPDTFYSMQPFIVLFATFCFPAGNYLVTWFNGESRPVIALGGFSALFCVLACAVFEFSSGWFIFTYALGMGIFKGLLQSALLRAGWSHLPGRKGLVSGAIISGYGFGGFFFGLYTNMLANPDNLHYEVSKDDGFEYLPKEVGDRVPFMLKILCLTWLIQIVIGLILITNFKSTDGPQNPLAENLIQADDEQQENQAEVNLPLKDIVFSPKFALLYALAVCHLFYGYYFTNIYKQYGSIYINDDAFLTKIGAFSALFNGFFKFVWATLLDYYAFRKIYGGLVCLEIFLIIVVQWAVHNDWFYLAVCCLTYMCDGSLTSMLPAITIGQFGIKRGPEIYSYMYSTFGVSSMIGLFLVNTVKDQIGYPGMFAIGGCFSSMAAILTYILREDQPFNYAAKYQAKYNYKQQS